MGDCKRNAGLAVMEASSSAAMSKRRKILGSKSKGLRPRHDSSWSTSIDELGIRSLAVNSPSKKLAGDVTRSSFSLDRSSPPAASCCSSNESSDDVVNDGFQVADLEVVKSSETADSTSINNTNKFSRETTPSSELCGDSEETSSAAAASNWRPSPAAGKAPPSDEIEEFFAMAEKSEQKRFTEKYNFDIVKDTPLEGRYQWVCLKP